MNPHPGPTEVIMLGTGTSYGVPMIGCACAVCRSPNPRNRRTRSSIWVRMAGVHLLVDTATELRLQCLANDVRAVDAVLFTHHHADHVLGLDDLRRFNWMMRRAVPCYGTEQTLKHIAGMFAYAFHSTSDSPHSRPELELNPIDAGPLVIDGATIIPIPLLHGPLPVLGFRFGRFAYCTDCNHIPDASLARLTDLDVLVLGAPLRRPHPAHFNVEEAVEMARRIGAKRTYFTHITHHLDHDDTNRELPRGIELAYDGQRFTWEDHPGGANGPW